MWWILERSALMAGRDPELTKHEFGGGLSTPGALFVRWEPFMTGGGQAPRSSLRAASSSERRMPK
jgi:hypothetical protein